LSSLLSIAASLPYYHIPSIPLGPLTLQPFGILVATGVLLGAWMARRHAEKLGLDDDELRGLTAWVLVGGFVGAHVFDVLAYQWDKMIEDPILLLKIWAGISSFGGFLGGILGYYIYGKRHKLPMLAYGDTMIYGLVPGFTIGRIGCTIVHDHVGHATDFVLGIDYPRSFAAQFGYAAATRMHNLGLYELIYLLPLCLVTLLVARKPRPYGFIAVVAATLYAPVRFALDFLRFSQSDPRYFGLTFAQWMAILAMLAGVIGMIRLARRPAPPFAERKPSAGPDVKPVAAGAGAAKRPAKGAKGR
jgi:phosphatidylglycerol---prolipoprotein diacylglyceryl transferase